MPSKKISKVNESEILTSNTEVIKPTKSKKKVSKDVEESKPINEVLKTESKPIDEPLKTTKTVKTKSVKSKTIDEPVKTEKLKKVKETVTEQSVKPKKETKSKEKVESDTESDDETQQIIKKELDNIKLSWLSKQNKLVEIETERTKIEDDIQNDIKKLKELLDKLLPENKTNEKDFLIDNKIQLNNSKNNIIPVDSDSTNESDDDTSESDSESDKKLTLLKNKKTKPLIKTTKGSTKNLKLNVNDSDSESD